MDWREKYKDKLMSTEEAVGLLDSSDTVVSSMCASVPYALMDVIAERADALAGMTIYLGSVAKPLKLYKGDASKKLNVKNFFFNAVERAYMPLGCRMSYQAMHLSNTTFDRLNDHIATAVVLAGAPPREDGLISISSCPLDTALLDSCKKIIIQINENLPYVPGVDTMFPVERVTCLVDKTESISTLPPDMAGPEEQAIGALIAERVPDGACIQLGIGGIAAAVGAFFKDKKDLGVHSEMFVDAMVSLMESGVVTNARKNLCPGKAVFGFAMGSRHMYEFIDGNDNLETRPFAWVNDPRIIAQNDNMISINGAMQIDLTGQVCSESIGQKQFSGTGGQLDFVRGSQWSKGGMSFICLPSSRMGKDGIRHSKIDLTLPLGSAVTTPRSDVHNIVTEYGVANIRNCTLDERARKLIAIAHPDFRDELSFQAKKAGLII